MTAVPAPTKVVVDTDIGSDLDDALALTYLLSRPDCDLLGITTVTGMPEIRAQLASVLCERAGVRIPIAVGADAPLRGDQLQPAVPQAEAVLGRWPHSDDVAEVGAARFTVELLRRHPGEITYLAIGPLTNLARAFRLDPELPTMLRSLVVMGGSFSPVEGRPSVEWNMRLDPVAAHEVLSAVACDTRLVGLDVTMDVELRAEGLRALCEANPRHLPLLDFSQAFFAQYSEVFLHDPVAAATIFDAGFGRFERGRVSVSRVDHRAAAGTTSFTADPAGPHMVAVSIDADAFLQHFRNVVCAAR